MNRFRTFFLMVLLTILFVVIGGTVGGSGGAVMAFLTGTIAATFAGAVAMLGQFARFGVGSQDRRGNPLGKMLILIGAPLGAMLIRMAVSRVREYAADEAGAKISRKPLELASALGKLSRGVQAIPLTRGNPAHSHMFIMNPFFGGLQRIFSTHPPAEERIRRLQLLAEKEVLLG